jgi:hypothetical protein
MKKGDIPSEDLGQLMETALQVTSEATLMSTPPVRRFVSRMRLSKSCLGIA